MARSNREELSSPEWTLKKSVTSLAIAPQTESLTRTARMAYNLMIFKAQRSVPDEDGGFCAPLSEIIKGFGATTRDSSRIKGYIEQMCTTAVRWFPLSRTDDPQSTLAGMEPTQAPTDTAEDGRIFTLLSEARFHRRSGEMWMTWFFPPTIKDMVIQPSRWAQLDIKEMATLSHYASVALYEICARYKDVPGGLTNRAAPSFWTQVLRPDPETKPREWRKFKNETLKPAIAEISNLTSLDIELIEERKGRAVVDVQFHVRRKATAPATKVDLSMVELGESMGVRERDLDQIIEEFGEEPVHRMLNVLAGRRRLQPNEVIRNTTAYLRKCLRNGAGAEDLLAPASDSAAHDVGPLQDLHPGLDREEGDRAWMQQRMKEINDGLDSLTSDEIETISVSVRASLAEKGLLVPSILKRFDQKQYRAPMVWEYIRTAYAEQKYGKEWRSRPTRSVVDLQS